MRGGDLSNELAPIVGMRFEGVVKTGGGKLNRAAKAFAQNLVMNAGYNIYIITTGNHRKALMFCVKWGFPWTQVLEADSVLEIPDICIENELRSYYDVDDQVLSNVRGRGKERVQAEQWTQAAD